MDSKDINQKPSSQLPLNSSDEYNDYLDKQEEILKILKEKQISKSTESQSHYTTTPLNSMNDRINDYKINLKKDKKLGDMKNNKKIFFILIFILISIFVYLIYKNFINKDK